MICHAGWLVLLLASGEARRDNVPYQVEWSVLLTAGQEVERECALSC